MRINMDCIRDILLCVEENTGLQQRCFFISYDLAKVQELIGLPAIISTHALREEGDIYQFSF